MQDTYTRDNRILRQFVQERTAHDLAARLGQMHAAAISDPEIKAVLQVKIGRNDSCPCGSGRKFKKCCISKVNR